MSSSRWITLLISTIGAASLRAQAVPPSYAEYRVDAIVTRGLAAQAGIGGVTSAGPYARLSLDAAAGPSWRDGSAAMSGRIDALGRFLLDPFRESPVALSLGGGVSVPYRRGDVHLRPYLTAVVDIEGRRRGPVTPALQLGIGGGVRVGVVFRRSPLRWR